jgi:hypothetical protein
VACKITETKALLITAAAHLTMAQRAMRDAAPNHSSPFNAPVTDGVRKLEKDIEMLHDRIKKFEETL